MADKLQVTIIGLGLIGTSAGLALRRFPEQVRLVGHDRDPGTAGKAKSMGAVERTEWNLISAVSQADRILLAVPTGEARETLQSIAQDLKPGCLILNMGPVDGSVLAAAAEVLPDGVHVIGCHPIVIGDLGDPAGARADLFDNKVICVTPDNRAGDTAATLAVDMAEALGGKPFFLDPAEYDGMIAAVEQLPLVLAGAMLEAASTSEVWKDMRRLAGSQFYTGTQIVSADAKAAASACVANRENVLRWLDKLTDALQEWRQRLASEDEASLTAAVEQGLEARQKWLQAQNSGDWEGAQTQPLPGSGSYMRNLLGLGGLERARKKGK